MAFKLVIIWAFVGVAVKQSSHQNIVMAIEIGAVIVAMAEF